MNELEKLEKKYGFTYPDIYKRLYAAGMLDYGEACEDWAERYYRKMAANPPLLLFAYDFELIDFPVIDQTIAEFRDPEGFRMILPEYNFIPFAQTAIGDLYVFQYDLRQGDDVPVTLLPEDDYYGIVQARNMQDFIFRELLFAATDINETMPLVTAGNRENALNMLRTHAPYLTKEQVDILTDVYNRKIRCIDDDGDPVLQMISEQECNKIISKVLAFDKLNYEFPYSDKEGEFDFEDEFDEEDLD